MSQILENNKPEWNLGPDNLYPASSFTSSNLNDAVKVRNDYKKLTINKKHPSTTPVSIFTKFKQSVENHPDKAALGMFIRLILKYSSASAL
jgi:hypothetical protein